MKSKDSTTYYTVEDHGLDCAGFVIKWENWEYDYDGWYIQKGYCKGCRFGFFQVKSVRTEDR